jgi:hypothetical protein
MTLYYTKVFSFLKHEITDSSKLQSCTKWKNSILYLHYEIHCTFHLLYSYSSSKIILAERWFGSFKGLYTEIDIGTWNKMIFINDYRTSSEYCIIDTESNPICISVTLVFDGHWDVRYSQYFVTKVFKCEM